MLHFSKDEFDAREAQVRAAMDARGIDALLLFAPESQYWLTGFDTFGYCFFQCLIVHGKGMTLLTRSADLRQAELTSTLTDIRIWKDAADTNPAKDLAALLTELGCNGQRLATEYDTHGLTAHNYRRLTGALGVEPDDASDLISTLRLIKSEAETGYVRKAADLADDALIAARPHLRAGGSEADVLASMQGAIFAGGGDYPGNEFIIGSGEHALLCRYQAAKRVLDTDDQITLEWAGAYRHYHAAAMRTIVIGEPRPEHEAMHDAARDALLACEDNLKPGRTFGDVFAAHASTFDGRGLGAHRLNACGYSLGARFSPSWMEHQMIFENAPTVVAPGMTIFLHMILMDSGSGSAMSLGRTSLVTDNGAEPLSRLDLDMMRG